MVYFKITNFRVIGEYICFEIKYQVYMICLKIILYLVILIWQKCRRCFIIIAENAMDEVETRLYNIRQDKISEDNVYQFLLFFDKLYDKFTLLQKPNIIKYLVFDVSSMELVGYFTIALKPLTVRGETVSNTVKKKLMRVSELDEQSQTYTMSAYLIAQLGKNFKNGAEKRLLVRNCLNLLGTLLKRCSTWVVEW